jgi:NAD(P)-dependent dehydrogenase (short-subunit alcohol dehydrogenase family)
VPSTSPGSQVQADPARYCRSHEEGSLNKGLGFETARQLLAAGHTVYAGARTHDNAQRAAVSMLTVQYARAFPDLRINVVDPGYTGLGTR